MAVSTPKFVNMNVRVLGNNAIFVQYLADGKSHDAAFPSWKEFLKWLKPQVLEAPLTEPLKTC
jgi:hypothetical protein